jgi:probable HAF family extracellular repeat protein
MLDLGTLGGDRSVAYGINSSGQVSGWSWTSGDGYQDAFLYSNGSMLNLGDLQQYGERPGSFAFGMNNSGQVVGIGDLNAFLYSNGSMQDLGTLYGGPRSAAQAINNNGQVVGYSWIPGGASHAFLYSNSTMLDLNNLIGTNSDWTLETATGINDSGQIVCDGISTSGQQDALLLNPITVPEPATLVLVLCGIGLFLPRLRKR